jgi:hypothetical protein
MRGKNHFTETEAKGIRALLDKKVVSGRKEQKAIREFLRKTHSFYISDFTSSKGFAPNDFDILISSGKIVVKK